MKRVILVSFVVLFAGLIPSAAAATVPSALPNYVPNEIIVKFRSSVDAGTSQTLHELNAKYKVREIKPLFKNFDADRRRIAALQQSSPASLTEKQKHILRRFERAAKNVNVPALERIHKLKLDLGENQSIQDAVAAYAASPDVEYAELNYLVSVTLTPNDPLYPLLWPLNNIGQLYPDSGRFNPPPGAPDSDIDAPEAWDTHTGSSNIIVAVIDTGVDYNHRDLQGNMWVNEAELTGTTGVDDDENGFIDDIYGYDFINEDADPIDDHGHGTHCSGIIGAEGNNGLDISGVCWDVRIMALKFLSYEGYGTMEDAIESFYYAVANGADITSNSWGGGGYSQALEEAITYANSQGVITVASAGNGGDDIPGYPAYYANVISVAATNSNDEKAPFSSFGDWVDIAAPGVDVLSLRAAGTSMGTVYDDYTTIASGTSMACPHIAGCCAVLLSANPSLSCDEVYLALMDTVDAISDGICLSDGRVNLSKALEAIVTSRGRIVFDQDYYNCSSVVSIFLADYDLEGTGTQTIAVTTSGGDSETILMREIATSAGVFGGEVSTALGEVTVEDGVLEISGEQIITGLYEDANDGTGKAVTATDTAIGDCVEPEIFNVHTDIAGRETRVHFETDEPSIGGVMCGLSCGGPYFIDGSDSNLTTNHSIRLRGFSPETEYFFIIEAVDAAGNETIDTNRGRCYRFTTTGPGSVYVPGQYSTIQEAIDGCWEGGTVWVADGRYRGAGNRDIDFKGMAITVRSENGPEDCIIDCNGTGAESHRGFYFHSGEDGNSVLSGFTVTNGFIYGSWYVGIGGAILCSEGSSPTITNCIFKDNIARWDGGGINNLNSSPTIRNCIFTGNWAVGNDGGAINNENSSPVIEGCTFRGNRAYDWGGAIRNVLDSHPTIRNCTLSGNSSDDGGGMFYFSNCNPTINNCTFSGNLANNGRALASDSWWLQNTIQMSNCILADGGSEIYKFDGSTITITYSNITGGWPGTGNINTDPCFVRSGHRDANDLWFDGNYRLLENSPCIDTGDPNYTPGPNETDLAGQSRLFDGDNDGVPIVDMGAYEYRPPILADVNIEPNPLNLQSRGNWLTCRIRLSGAHNAADIAPDSIFLEGIISASSLQINNNVAIVRFSRSEVQSLLIIGENKLTITGELIDGTIFEGMGVVRVINKGVKK